MKGIYTNKQTGEIQDGLMKNVIDLVSSQVEEERASQVPSEDDGSSSSQNLSTARINEIVGAVICITLTL